MTDLIIILKEHLSQSKRKNNMWMLKVTYFLTNIHSKIRGENTMPKLKIKLINF